jgi:hypothetical protein
MWFGPPECNTLHPQVNRVVLLKPVLPEPTFLSAPMKWHLPEPFIAQGQAVPKGPEVQQVASGQVKPYAIGHNC